MRFDSPGGPAVEALAERLERLFPQLDAAGRELALAIYAKLAEGSPVELGDAQARVASWPGVYYDAERRIIGFWGLTVRPTRHLLRVNGRELFAWCAWDTLFIPELLGASAEVASSCHATGAPVRLRVGPNAVERSEPEGLHLSLVVPEEEAVRADVITGFCHYVHFFSSKAAAVPWLERHAGARLLSLAEAFEVGRVLNARRYSSR